MKRIVVFTGAGMSAESGVQTFRDGDGLWEQHRIEDVATPEAWSRDPDLVTTFYNQRRKRIIEVQPNEGHKMIAELEQLADVVVITQNIDDLHERAGSKNVLHLHGNIRMSKSSGPNQENAHYPINGWELTANDVCPEGYRLRPHVVWFGESVPAYDEAVHILSESDILIVVGTSLQVYPAAGLIHYATKAQKHYIIDPQAKDLVVPPYFSRISKGAGEGIKSVIDLIKKGAV